VKLDLFSGSRFTKHCKRAAKWFVETYSQPDNEGKADARAEQATRDIPRASRRRVIEILLAFDGLPAAMFARENKLVSVK
jgi:hypothetical protein